ncbi:PREDICTED: myocardial zonula adherens protein [Odobenus rosmarus divergens]|uniref:Myocardial zonula adherens protein n=1 Tax=Odobenus rosmarus divergens TaxID=9708 RepID=A0A9B0GXL8_ODORO
MIPEVFWVHRIKQFHEKGRNFDRSPSGVNFFAAPPPLPACTQCCNQRQVEIKLAFEATELMDKNQLFTLMETTGTWALPVRCPPPLDLHLRLQTSPFGKAATTRVKGMCSGAGCLGFIPTPSLLRPGGRRALIRRRAARPAAGCRCGMLRSTSTVTLLSGGGARAPSRRGGAGAAAVPLPRPGRLAMRCEGCSAQANVCRLRLTIPPESPTSESGEKKVGRKEQHLDLSNGEPTRKLPQGVVYGVVRRSDPNEQKEMVVYGWSTNQLKEEMNYIRDVRATLEKVRKRMYGDYDEMRQKIRQLTQELSASQARQEYLENHVQTQSSALDSFNATNSALTSDSIGLQKTLVDVTLENSSIKDQMRDLQQTYEASMGQLWEKQRQLEVAQVENQLLKMKVESSQEANAEVMREMTKRLYSQYEEKLQEERQNHSAEKEALLEETKNFLKAIEEANKKMEAAEISLEEKDQRIGELDRLIERMEKERHQLQLQLLDHETEMSGEIMDSDKERYQQLEEASASLRERIRHLDDMVHCQQKKVKQMVEEIESLKKKMQQKQLLILQLLEKISFLEGENNELQSRLDYLIETQAKPEVETREIGVGCDLLPSPTGRTREISMPSRNYTPYTRVLELTMKKTLT